MKCIPRASFSIAILDDEDFGVLMEEPGGMEAFGLFVAIVIAGRSRLQLERAERVGKTDALVFVDRNRHLLSMIQADQGQFDRCLAAFARVAKDTGGEPWVHLDQSGRLVIRSFFKFNTNTGWGGARGGAGRKSSRNQDDHRGIQVFQDDSKPNHLEKLEKPHGESSVSSGPVGQQSSVSSALCSGTGTGTGTGNTPPTPQGGGGEQSRNSGSQKPIADESEPFDSGQSNPIPKAGVPKPLVENDPDEISRLVSKAEAIFRSNFDVGMSVREAARRFKAEWIDEALDIAQENNAQNWGFLRSVFSRFTVQGMTDSEKHARDWKKKRETSLWDQPSHVPEPDPLRPKNIRSRNALSESEILEFQTRGVA